MSQCAKLHHVYMLLVAVVGRAELIQISQLNVVKVLLMARGFLLERRVAARTMSSARKKGDEKNEA